MINRPLCIATIFYIIGIIIGLYLQNLGIVLLLCIAIIISCIKRRKKLFIYILILIIGFLYIKFIDYKYNNMYTSFDMQKEHIIEGVIVSERSEKEYKNVYDFEVKKIDDVKISGENKFLLNIKKSKNTKIEFGDYIKINAKIELPYKARNYMGFDYQKYLKSKKIYANITDVKNLKLVNKNQANMLKKVFNDTRNDIKTKVYKLLPKDARELAVGIMVGEKSDINDKIIDDFKNSNLTHMLAVSGAHILYVLLGLNLLLKKTSSRFRNIFIIFFLIYFIGITNFSPSVQRASIMTILMLISKMIYRKHDTYTSIAFYALTILIINPYAILDIGFQLSFAGTIGIVALHSKMFEKFSNVKSKFIKYIINSICISICANLIIIPIMSINFNSISFTFWISNLLAGPFLGIIIILGFCMYILSYLFNPIAQVISIILKYLIYILIYIAKYCSRIPFSSVIIRTPYIFEILIYYMVLYLIFNYTKIKIYIKNIIVIILIFTLIANSCIYIENHCDLMIYFIDVGQGDSTLIRTVENKTILIDGGGSENSSFDVGKKTLLPYLLDRKITVLDYVIISHFDSDHCGGILYLMEHIKIRNIIIAKQGRESLNYSKFKNIAVTNKMTVVCVEKGDRINIDNQTYLEVLFPTDNLILENILNNNSIVAKLHYNKFSILFTGDIEKIAEEELSRKYCNTNKLNADVLKVAHHGSKTSSTDNILKLIKPEIALIGVGEKNTFGHPNEGVIERFEKMNIKIYRTDKMGEIILQVKNTGKIKIKTQL